MKFLRRILSNVVAGIQKWYKGLKMPDRLSSKQKIDLILDVVVENNRLIREIIYFLRRVAMVPTAIHIQGVTMPATLTVGQSVPVTATETDAAGASVPISVPGNLNWTTTDPTIASVGTTATDGSNSYTAVAVGTVTVAVTDPANSLTTSDSITVIAAPPPVATAIAINFGTPV